MVVTCPNCRARYAVDPQKIGSAGRTVQCARCSHRWFEKIESPPPAVAEAAPPAPESDPASEPAVAAAPAPVPAPEPAPEMVIRPISAGSALPAVIPPKPVFPWRRAAVAAIVALVLVGGALFAFRGEIAALLPNEMPATAPATAAAKPPRPPAAPSRPQIEIDLEVSKVEVVDGRYVVHGEVVNKGTAPGSTSLLRVTFKRNDEVLGERSFPLVEGPLPPGGRANFSQVLEDPPAGTTDIVPVVE
jgi:predicted Zn finger-like uncharacterized protein